MPFDRSIVFWLAITYKRHGVDSVKYIYELGLVTFVDLIARDEDIISFVGLLPSICQILFWNVQYS